MHFDLAGEAVVTDDTKLLAAETGSHDSIDVGHTGGVKWVASFAPRSRVRLGDDVTIVADIERIHWFDPHSGDAIRG